MISSDVFMDITDINDCSSREEIEDKESSLQEIMDISPSMLSSSSPAKTDWLGQLTYDANKCIYL